jgi:hypothetical protein
LAELREATLSYVTLRHSTRACGACVAKSGVMLKRWQTGSLKWQSVCHAMCHAMCAMLCAIGTPLPHATVHTAAAGGARACIKPEAVHWAGMWELVL